MCSSDLSCADYGALKNCLQSECEASCGVGNCSPNYTGDYVACDSGASCFPHGSWVCNTPTPTATASPTPTIDCPGPVIPASGLGSTGCTAPDPGTASCADYGALKNCLQSECEASCGVGNCSPNYTGDYVACDSGASCFPHGSWVCNTPTQIGRAHV